MNVIIVGGGVTGCELTRRLIQKQHQVTLIERNEDNARHVANRLDCMVIGASGNDTQILLDAGIQKADTLIVVTDSDELNLIICGIADGIAPNVQKIARVRNENYVKALNTSKEGTLGIDVLVYPDEEVAKTIITTVEHGAISDIINFKNSRYDVTRFPINKKSALDGARIQDIRRYVDVPFVVVSVEREKETIIPTGDTVLNAGEKVSILAAPEDFAKFYDLSGFHTHTFKKIALVGMDEIGYRLAGHLTQRKSKRFFENLLPITSLPRWQLIIVEKNESRAKQAAADFPEATVYNADITDEAFIDEADLRSCDLVITATKNYELNMISSAYLKTLGVFKTISVVQSSLLENIAYTLGIDIAVSFKGVVVDSIMSHLAGKQVTGIHTIGDGLLEIIEFIVPENSPIVGKALQDIAQAGSFLVLLILRDSQSVIPIGSTVFNANDTIVFITQTNKTNAVITLFNGKQ